jgi:alkanesulfonate monooxygenase SsuD/methylene tetrahydromethanopterin reductase-like flavin-dependent oxidoreductase (luciferase family)
VARARQLIDEGRSRAGRTDPHPVAMYLHAATGPDAAQRLERERVLWGYPDLTDRAVSGSAEEVANGVRRWAAAGVDVVVLQPTPDDPDHEGFIRFVATEVAPLVG